MTPTEKLVLGYLGVALFGTFLACLMFHGAKPKRRIEIEEKKAG